MYLPAKKQLVKQQPIIIKSKEDEFNNSDDKDSNKKIVIEKLNILKSDSESAQAPPTPPQLIKPVVNQIFFIFQHFNLLILMINHLSKTKKRKMFCLSHQHPFV
jgi:hypothetical protein